MTMRDPAASRPEIKALTSLRGIAAMAVVLQHFSATASHLTAGWIPSLIPHGYMAVDFFFVLSGFIMSYTYLAGFEALGMRAYGPFLWKRVARIFPLGIAVTAIILFAGAVASLWGDPALFINWKVLGDGLGTAVAINLLHLQGFFTDYNLNDPSWSVSVELAAYLLFPALIVMMFKVPRWATGLYSAVGVCVLLRIATVDPEVGLGYRWAPYDLARCVVEFGFGMIVYRVYRAPSKLHAIGGDRLTWIVAALCLLCFVARIDLLAAFSFPFVVLAFALNRGAPSRLLSRKLPYFLGTISFSIYLVHHLFRAPELLLVRTLHPEPVAPVLAVLFAALGSLSVLPFAAMAYHGVEKPGRIALNGLVRKLRRGPPVPATASGGR